MATKESTTPYKSDNRRTYLFPEDGFSVQAENLQEAEELAAKKRKENK